MAAPEGNTNRATQYRIKRTLEKLFEEASTKREGMTRLEAACRAQMEKAEDGDLAAFKEVADRAEGKAAQSLDLGNKDGEPFRAVQRIELVDLGADGASSSTP